MTRRLLQVVVGLFVAPLVNQPVAAQSQLAKTTVSYRKVDGHAILADVYRPAGEQVRPVIVWIHGGALIMGHRESVPRHIRELAEEHGFGLVSIDYRLAPESKLPELISDVEAAFRWLGDEGAKQFHLDPQRIVVCGGSAGGYLTFVSGYRVRPRPKALVSLYGYGDLTADWYVKPSPHPRHNPRKISSEEAARQTDGTIVSDARRRSGDGSILYLYYRQNGIWPQQVTGFDASEIAEKIAPYEPVRNVTPDFPPTLVIHGTRDTDVPYSESVKMAEQFESHGVPFVLKTIDKGEHGLVGGDPQQIEEAYATMRAFILKHLVAE